jgi:hypothetical protein
MPATTLDVLKSRMDMPRSDGDHGQYWLSDVTPHGSGKKWLQTQHASSYPGRAEGSHHRKR